MTPHPADGQVAAWAHTPERSNMQLLRIMVWISMRMGRRASRVVLHAISVYFLLFARTNRNASRKYLRLVLDRTPSWRDLYRHFFTFATTVHDRVYLLKRRFDLFEFEIHGEEEMRRLLTDGKGLFLMGAHLGSFEVIRAIGWKNADLRVAMVMHQGNAQKIIATLTTINPQSARDIIELGCIDSMLQVQERLDAGGVVGMLADRTPGEEVLRTVQILGADANLPVGPFRMAALLQRPVVFMTGLYLGGNRYSVHFERLADFSGVTRAQRDAAVEAAISRYAALLDQYCRKAPYNWFNFFDFWQHESVKRTAKTS
jgi:predicted LPLAT superfamily acyltransferase